MNKVSSFLIAILFTLIFASTAIAINPPTVTSSINMADLLSGKQTLIVGDMTDLPPFDSMQNNKLKGMNVDIFKEVAKRAGIKRVKFVGLPVDESIRYPALLNGKVDLLLHVLDKPLVRDEFLVTIPFYTKGGLCFVYFSKTGPYKIIDDLRGHTIGTLKGAYWVTWLQHYEIPAQSIKLYETHAELMQALKQHAVDVALTLDTFGLYEQQPFNNQLAVTLAQPMQHTYALRKQDSALQKALNKALDSMWADGTLYKIEKRYLGPLNIEPAHSYKAT